LISNCKFKVFLNTPYKYISFTKSNKFTVYFCLRSVTTAYYKGAVGAIITYDITKIRSFENASRWIDDIRHTLGSDSPIILLLGNKLDLRHHRSVTTEEGHKMAQNKKTLFIEASAKDGTNIHKAFDLLVDHVKDQVAESELRRDVECGAGLERGAKALSQTERKRKDPVSVVQTQPKSTCSLRESTHRCVERAKELCCSKFYCCM